MIHFSCPRCFAGIKAPDGRAGHAATCPGCKSRLVVPGRPMATTLDEATLPTTLHEAPPAQPRTELYEQSGQQLQAGLCCPRCGKSASADGCPHCGLKRRPAAAGDGDQPGSGEDWVIDAEAALDADDAGANVGGYRCLHCRSRRPPETKRFRTPLGTLLEVFVGLAGLVLLVGLVGVLAAGPSPNRYGETDSTPTGLLVAILVGAALFWLGCLMGIEWLLKEQRRVCPDCKARIG